MIFSEAIRGYYLDLTVSPNHSSITAIDYRDKLMRICQEWNDPQVEQITKVMIQEYLAGVKQKGWSLSSVKFYHRVLRGFFVWAERVLDVKRPDADIPVPVVADPEIIPFSREDLTRLFAAAKRPRQKAILCLLLDTGIRASELCRATLGDLDLVSGQIIVQKYQTGKKSRKRELYIEDTSRNAVWHYLAGRKHRQPSDPLIASDNKSETFINRFDLNHAVHRIGLAARMFDVGPQRFRHTFAVEYLRNGGDVFTLRRLLGHSSLKMVQQYLVIAQADVKTTHRRASPVDNLRIK